MYILHIIPMTDNLDSRLDIAETLAPVDGR